jgi:hypothetical protein
MRYYSLTSDQCRLSRTLTALVTRIIDRDKEGQCIGEPIVVEDGRIGSLTAAEEDELIQNWPVV